MPQGAVHGWAWKETSPIKAKSRPFSGTIGKEKFCTVTAELGEIKFGGAG